DDLRSSFLKRYQQRWMHSFGWDFAWSRRMAWFCGRFPGLLDAWAEATRQHGTGFLEEWATIMTGARPKSQFFRPRLVLPILWQVARQMVRRKRLEPAPS